MKPSQITKTLVAAIFLYSFAAPLVTAPLVTAPLVIAQPVPTPPLRAGGPLEGGALVEALRKGGYTIYFRHAETDWSNDDNVGGMGDWTSCDPGRMRQLSAKGRETARRIGAAIRKLGIPVGRVLSSEYCRAAETARRMGLGQVVTTRNLMNMRVADYMGGDEAVATRAREVIATPPPAGTNTVIAAHGNLMRAATGHYVGEGGAGIFRPDGKGSFTFIAEVTPEQWTRLAGRFGKGR